MIAWAISGPGGRGSILFTTAREIRPETWYRRNITYLLYRYTFVPNLCIPFAPVHVSIPFFYHGQSEVAFKDGRAQDSIQKKNHSRKDFKQGFRLYLFESPKYGKVPGTKSRLGRLHDLDTI